MITQSDPHNAETSLDERDTLAPWTYQSQAFFELEQQWLFKGHWQLAGHVSQLKNIGDFITFEACGERALIIHDGEGNLNAFHNVCRHRGAPLLSTRQGHCKHAISCPFHGWRYALDGRLKNIPQRKTFEIFNDADYNLVRLPMEMWHGLIFIHFGQPNQSIQVQLQPLNDRIAPYQISAMNSYSSYYEELRPYNWKIIHDIDNEGYHVPVGHPSLQQLYGQSYQDRLEQGFAISDATISDKPAQLWSVRHYQKLLPTFDHLPAERQRCWWYIGLFPNLVIALYPDLVEYYMTIPISPTQTRMLGASFALPDARREVHAARYLNQRINRTTDREDESFVAGIQQGMDSSAFPIPTFSSTELGVRDFHAKVQCAIPVARLAKAPSEQTMARVNVDLRAGHGAADEA